jgi:hypothetical protein
MATGYMMEIPGSISGRGKIFLLSESRLALGLALVLVRMGGRWNWLRTVPREGCLY